MYQKENQDLIYGLRATMEALESGREISKIIIKKGIGSELFQELYHAIKEAEVPFQIVPPDYFKKFPGKNHQGVICMTSPIEFQNLDEILTRVFESGEMPFILMLDKVSDVRNFGAICRSAECSGVHAIVIPSKGAAIINSDAVKTSAGALNHIPVCRENNLKKTIQQLKQHGLAVYGASERAEVLYFEQKLSGPIAILMGSEDQGVAPEYRVLCDGELKIPMLGKIDSLNVSVATGILCYEVVRQRNI
jgi:23S rRNA (guanosine2251-2'-O)-methyltransferase